AVGAGMHVVVGADPLALLSVGPLLVGAGLEHAEVALDADDGRIAARAGLLAAAAALLVDLDRELAGARVALETTAAAMSLPKCHRAAEGIRIDRVVVARGVTEQPQRLADLIERMRSIGGDNQKPGVPRRRRGRTVAGKAIQRIERIPPGG